MATCPKCEGHKKIIIQLAFSGGGSIGAEVDCDQCKGMGKVGIEGVCETCNGSKKTVKPLGLSSGRQIGIEVDCHCVEPDDIL